MSSQVCFKDNKHLISSPSSLATKWNAGWAEILSQGTLSIWTAIDQCDILNPAHASQVSIFNPPDHMSTTHHDGIWFMAAWLYIEPTPRVDRRRTQSIAITSRGRPREQPTVWSRRTLLSLHWTLTVFFRLACSEVHIHLQTLPFRKCVKLHAQIPKCYAKSPPRCDLSVTYHGVPLTLSRLHPRVQYDNTAD